MEAGDEAFIAEERRLRLSDGIAQVRPEELEWKALFSMSHTPYVILRDGRFEGSFLLSKRFGETARISDLRLLHETEAVRVMNDLLKFLSDRKDLSVSGIAPDRRILISTLYRSADCLRIVESEQICILNYEHTIKAYLDYKAACTELTDGQIILGFENGEIVKIAVLDGAVKVSDALAEDPSVRPDLTLSPLEAVNMLFGNGMYLNGLDYPLPKEVRSWFPLPFFVAMSDKV